jgi:hypothetical protein
MGPWGKGRWVRPPFRGVTGSLIEAPAPPGNRHASRIREALLPDVLRPRRRFVSGQGDSIREWRARKVWEEGEWEEWEDDEDFEEEWDEEEAWWEEEDTGPGRSSLPMS